MFLVSGIEKLESESILVKVVKAFPLNNFEGFQVLLVYFEPQMDNNPSGTTPSDVNIPLPADISRLPSFKAPRDLTLSKTGRSRRHYVPNIPPKRERNEPTDSTGQKSSTEMTQFTKPSIPGPSQAKIRQSRPLVRGGLGLYTQRGGARAPRPPRPELVQSASIFAEGIGSKAASRGSPSVTGTGRSRTSGGRSSGSSNSDLQKSFQRNSSFDNENRIQGQNDDETINMEDDEPIGGLGTFVKDLHQGPIPNSLRPVALPLSNYISMACNKRKEPRLTPGDSFSDFVNKAPRGALMYLQLPDILPFRKEQANNDPNKKDTNLHRKLQDLKPGQIGKIRVHASGKTTLLLGKGSCSSEFEIEPSRAIAFRQELVMTDLEAKRLVQLGKVQHKFMCIPELSHLFDKVL